MPDFLFSPFIVPTVAILAGVAFIGTSAWRKVREKEMLLDQELRLKEMEHQQKMKEMELELARLKNTNP